MSRNDADALTTRGIAGEDIAPVPAAGTKTAFQQMLEDDAALFINADEFAEPITYTPHVGTPVSISAIVERNPENKPQLQVIARGEQRVPQGVVEIYVANSATTGVASVKERFDSVTLPLKQGGAIMTTLRVTKILSQDAGMWRLECTA